jgi:hypothetical protein
MATSLRNLIRPDSLAREYVKSRGSRSKSRKEAEKGFMPSQCLGARGSRAARRHMPCLLARPPPRFVITSLAPLGFRRTVQQPEEEVMSTVFNIFAIVVMVAVVIVLIRGLLNMMRGGSGSTSNRLMQTRVLLQAIALVFIMLALWYAKATHS